MTDRFNSSNREVAQLVNTSKASTSIMHCGNAMGASLALMWFTRQITYGAHGRRVVHLVQDIIDASLDGLMVLSLTIGFFNWVYQSSNVMKGKVLISDNLSSDMSVELLRSCNENQIAFVSLPPNSTHFTQTLDINFYKQLKVNWRKVITAWKLNTRSTQCSLMSKDLFPRKLKPLLKSIDEKAAENLISGFRKAGNYPLDRGQV